MPSKFRRGAKAYAANGTVYTVDDIEDGILYCSLPSGAEAEFREDSLLTEAEWGARTGKRREVAYDRLKLAKPYTEIKGKLDPTACQQLLTRCEKLSPGILDFTAYTTAVRILTDQGDKDLVPGLTILKCRAVFDAVRVEVRACRLADLLGLAPDVLVGAGRLGDNLMKAMVDKGLAAREVEYDDFRNRRRN